VQQSRAQGPETIETRGNGTLQQKRRRKFIHPRLLGDWKGQAVKARGAPGRPEPWLRRTANALGYPASTTPLATVVFHTTLTALDHSSPLLHHSSALHQFSTVPPPHKLAAYCHCALPFLPISRRLEHRLPPDAEREDTMADAAQRVLMNEFKALSKETWTHIEVCYLMSFISSVSYPPCCSWSGGHYGSVTDKPSVNERQRFRVERSTHCAEPRLPLLRRIFQGQDDLPPQLPSLSTRYVTPAPRTRTDQDGLL
jgi:hypothetical protein